MLQPVIMREPIHRAAVELCRKNMKRQRGERNLFDQRHLLSMSV